MPGVPTYRGCDACHRQKKKCDQASPPCTRCARLKIPCTGKGQMRYKFKEQCTSVAPVKTGRFKSFSLKTLSPPASPNNAITRLSRRFASALQIDEPQFDLKLFGAWFARIPIRMGAYEHLDHATETFLDAHDNLRSGQRSTKWYSNNNKALTSLHNALKDTRQPNFPYTLCSILLIMISQIWVLKSAQCYIEHMEGICSILNTKTNEPWDDPFSQSLLQALIVSACNEAILNPNISIDGEYLRILKTRLGPRPPLNKERGRAIESMELPCLMRFPYFVRQPEMHHNDMIREYTLMQIECPVVRHQLMERINAIKTQRMPPRDLVRAHFLLGEQYNIMLSRTLIMNAFLSAMDPTNIQLQEEALYYSQEALWITRILGGPLATRAGFMPAALFSAEVATDETEVISNIDSIKEKSDCYWAEPHYVEQYTALKKRVREIRDRKLAELPTGGLQGMNAIDFITSDGHEYTWCLGAPLVDSDYTDYLQHGNPPGMVVLGAGCRVGETDELDIQYGTTFVAEYTPWQWHGANE